MYIVASPSYGRDYKSARETLAAWHEGKDFTIQGPLEESGRQINKADTKPGDVVQLRFKRMSGVCVVKHGAQPKPQPRPAALAPDSSVSVIPPKRR